MDAIILAGGSGKRLRPITDSMPKCMVPINDKPMLQHHIDPLKKAKIGKIIVACGYKWEEIKKHYGSSLVYAVEDEPLGTSGAVKNSLQYVDGHEFIVINADDLTNIDFNKLIKLGSNATAVGLLKSPFGVVDITDGKIRRFREKPVLPHYINIGIHILNRDVKFLDKGSLEFDVLPKLADRGLLKAYKHPGYWVTVNTMKDLEGAEKALK
jgi:NDP-sugar pyrophosphorylase family protein